MTQYANYLFEANVCLVFFLFLYWILLKKETSFRLVRFIMLGGIGISLIFPLIHFKSDAAFTIPVLGRVIPSYWMPEVVIGDEINSVIAAHNTDYTVADYFTILYIAGVVVTAAIFLLQFSKLVRFIWQANSSAMGGSQIIETNSTHTSFSFFNYIFLNHSEDLSAAEKQHIIDHERTHSKQLHSIDILLISLLRIVFWFNPFLYFYKKIFVQLHEFEADARAVKDHDVDKYCSLLARVALQSAGLVIANHFNNSLTLKRIQMMRTIKTGIKWWKVTAFASALPLLFFAIACQDQLADKESQNLPEEVQLKYEAFKNEFPGENFIVEYDKNADAKLKELEDKYGHARHIELLTVTVNGKARTYSMLQYADKTIAETVISSSDKIFVVVEKMPEYKGGMEALAAFLQDNMRYPESAREQGKEGTSFVSFIVEKDGSISDIEVKRGFDAACDAESKRVVSTLVDWNPGKQNGEIVRCRLTLPIKFKLD